MRPFDSKRKRQGTIDAMAESRKWVRVLTVVLCLTIAVFVASNLFGSQSLERSYVAYNSIASVLILNIIIFLYFHYISVHEEIQENERRYALLFDNINDVMLIRTIGADGLPERYLEANRASAALLGYSKEELRSMLPEDIVAPERREEVRKAIGEILRTGRKTFESELASKNGRRIPVEVSSHIFELKGQRVMMTIARDLTEREKNRQIIRETEKRYRSIFEGLPDGVLIQHFPENESIIIFANKSAADMFGCETPGELVGRNFIDLVEVSAKEDILRRRNLLLEGKPIPLVERTIPLPGGKERIVEIKTIPYPAAGRRHYISIIRDVTLKKANERILKENDRQLRRLLDISPDAVFVYDWEKYLYCNESGAFLVGEQSPKDVMDKSIYTYIHPGHFENLRERLHRLEEPEAKVPMIEHRLLTKEGKEVVVETKTIRIPFGGRTAFVSMSRDVTQRTLLEEERRRSEERYRKLIENFPDAVLVYDRNAYLFANRSAARLLGLQTPEELVGRPLMYFFDETAKPLLNERLAVLEESGCQLPLIEEEIHTEKGGRKPVEIKTIQFPYGETPSYLSVLRDITERKRNEELRRNMEITKRRMDQQMEYERMRTEYFANISHEFRTPINVISSALDLMELKSGEILKAMPDYGVRHKRHLQIMKQNKNRLIKLVNNLIDINKVEAGFKEINKRNHRISELIESLVGSVTELAASEGIDMVFNRIGGPVVAACDSDKIERVMLNLLSNALKFTPRQGRVITTLWQEDKQLWVSVEDTGIGIEAKDMERIFDRFSQAGDLFTRQNEGSGIGLSLVKAYVKMHGGHVRATSVPGAGSRFVFSIPMELVMDETGHPMPVEPVEDPFRGSRLEIEFSDVKKRHYEH